MEIKPLPIYYSRSAVTADWSCPRKRYWGYEYAGRGLNPASTAYELAFGTLIHDGLAAIVHGAGIDEIADAAKAELRASLLAGQEFDADAQNLAEEQCALAEGLLRAFHRHNWQLLMEEYETVAIEKELLYEHDGLTFMAKPDLLLRHKESDELVYLEFKTTSSIKDQWMGSWQTAVQLHSTIRACEAALGETISKVVVQGLHKGYVSQYDRQESIFCYGYHKPGNPPFTPDKWSYVYAYGLKKQPTWKKEGGVKKWVEEMPENIISQQLPQTPPIFVNRDLVDAFFRQRAIREHNIRTARNRILDPMNPLMQNQLDEYFPQHFEQCSPGWGKGCQFKKLCFGSHSDPLQAGFQLRLSHHEAERQQQLDNHPPNC